MTTLRSRLIRLAHSNAAARAHLLPLLQEEPQAARVASRYEASFFGGKAPLVLQQYPSGRWGFVGRVPAEIGWMRKDDKPMSEEDLKDLASSNMPALKYKQKAYGTKNEAIAAAKSVGAKITQILEK